MTWVRHDDGFSSHPKVIGLSDKAYRLHFCALEACARHLTDGLITQETLRSAAGSAGVLRPNAVAISLVSAGLWKPIRGRKWRIHDYLDYNPSREEVLQERAKARERQRNFRQRRHGVTNTVSNAVSSPSPSRPLVSTNVESRDTPAFTCPKCGLNSLRTKERLDEHLRNVHDIEVAA
jgi:hypothetical protein